MSACEQRLPRLFTLPAWGLILPLLAGCQHGKRSAVAGRPFGWDYNLTRRCVRSPHPDADNYYEDSADCPFPDKNWTVAVQSETVLGGYGPRDQSFLVNGKGSPVTMDWTAHTDEFRNRNWSVRLNTDLCSVEHPGGVGYFTWFVFMDHTGHGGGPLPSPNELAFSVAVSFGDVCRNGATRAFVGFTGSWDGRTRGAEICFALANWGDADPEPDVVAAIKNDRLEFVTMDGSAIGVSVCRGRETTLAVDWWRIIHDLVARGYFSKPTSGWASAATTAVYVGTEVNNFTASQAASASLSFSNFRVTRRAWPDRTPVSLAQDRPE